MYGEDGSNDQREGIKCMGDKMNGERGQNEWREETKRSEESKGEEVLDKKVENGEENRRGGTKS